MTEPTPLRPRPGHPFYLYGADLIEQIRTEIARHLGTDTEEIRP